MKTILLLRHAKSDWNADYGSDHDRPLSKRGRKASKLIGKALARTDRRPELVITSSARRAQETVRLARRAGDWSAPVEIAPEFYGAAAGDLLTRVRLVDDSIACVLLAGHEPTWSDACSLFVGGGRFRFPTAALARIDFDSPSWKLLSFSTGSLIWSLTPRLLSSLD